MNKQTNTPKYLLFTYRNTIIVFIVEILVLMVCGTNLSKCIRFSTWHDCEYVVFPAIVSQCTYRVKSQYAKSACVYVFELFI